MGGCCRPGTQQRVPFCHSCRARQGAKLRKLGGTQRMLMHALQLVSSRTFEMLDGQMLVPLADMGNHQQDCECCLWVVGWGLASRITPSRAGRCCTCC